jgi:hypothetical protein
MMDALYVAAAWLILVDVLLCLASAVWERER